jgi:prepilin-type processing-associated H-X9-DG protein
MPARGSVARRTLLRSLVLFTPFLVLAVAALVYVIMDVVRHGADATVVAVVLLSFVTALLAYQVVQSLRDMFSGLVETTGVVERYWTRHELILFRGNYLFLDGNVFRLEPHQAVDLKLGQTVRLVHYPHTGAVDSVEVIRPDEAVGKT